jgi:hypothetical protein
LEELGNGWLARKIADHEAEKGRIMEIFERINEARVQFEVCAVSSFISRPKFRVYVLE